jgi:hypothetical protein
MADRKRFRLIYDHEIIFHLQTIERKYHSLIRTRVEEQLRFEPDIETRNRKPLERPAPFSARWELRFGPDNRFRVFYRIVYEEQAVYILAIGEKHRNQLFIGGKEFEQ